MKALLVVVLALALNGCATLGTIATAGQRICDSKDAITTAFDLALTQSFTIADETRRDLTQQGLRIALSALSACPE